VPDCVCAECIAIQASVDFKQFLDFPYAAFDAGSFVKAQAILHICSYFMLANPVIEVLLYAPCREVNGLNAGSQGLEFPPLINHHADIAPMSSSGFLPHRSDDRSTLCFGLWFFLWLFGSFLAFDPLHKLEDPLRTSEPKWFMSFFQRQHTKQQILNFLKIAKIY